MGRRKKKNLLKNIILIALIYFAYRYMGANEEIMLTGAGENSYLQGEWRAQTDGYENVKVVIDADSLMVYAGEEMLCDEEYSINERTLLITGAYRQDFELFALFEYREGEGDGKSVLIGSAIQQDGKAEEVYFSKNQTGSGRLMTK